jgi:hypothetical protein
MTFQVFQELQRVRSSASGEVTLTFKPSPVLKRIGEQMEILTGLAITVGYQGQSGLAMYPGKDRINVATVAMFHVFGTEDMPKRDFMRSALEVGREELRELIVRQFGLVATGKRKAMDAMATIGQRAAQLIVKRIDTATSWATPLDSATTTRKGSSAPLRDTGLLRDSVTWAVRKGSVRGPILREGKA